MKDAVNVRWCQSFACGRVPIESAACVELLLHVNEQLVERILRHGSANALDPLITVCLSLGLDAI